MVEQQGEICDNPFLMENISKPKSIKVGGSKNKKFYFRKPLLAKSIT